MKVRYRRACRHCVPSAIGRRATSSVWLENTAPDPQRQVPRHSGTLSFQELAALPAFAALPFEGQRTLLAELRRIIFDAKLDNGIIDIFERVKCVDRNTGPMHTYVDGWLSAGHEERRTSC